MLQRAQNQPRNLAQLKRALTDGAVYRIVKHYIKEEYTGQIRIIQHAGSTIFYSGIYGEPESDFSRMNYGKGIYTQFGNAKDWIFSDVITMTYKGKPIMEIEIMEEVAEAPTTEETSEAAQDTTCADKEPQEGTERATEGRGKRANYTGAALYTFERIHPTSTYIPNQLYKTAEGHLYYINTHGYMHILTGSREKSADGTKYYCIIDNLLTADNHLHESCKTFYTTAAAAREKVKEMEQTAIEAAESREEIEPQEDTTTPETNAQRAAESAETTADDTTPTAGETEPQRATQTAIATTGRKSITTPTEATQEAPQTAGTSEGGATTTPPHTEPPRATERAAGSVSQSDRRTRPAAPQSHETTKGIQRHHWPPKTAYRATQSATADHRRRVEASRGSPKICISWG